MICYLEIKQYLLMKPYLVKNLSSDKIYVVIKFVKFFLWKELIL